MDEDIVIRGGMLVDGSGASGRMADVAVRDGKIVAVGQGLAGSTELDASGQVVAPGFIDIHTHYDAQVFWDPTSPILVPWRDHGGGRQLRVLHRPHPARGDGDRRPHLQHVEDMSFDTLVAGVPWDEFETFAGYLDAVERRGVASTTAVTSAIPPSACSPWVTRPTSERRRHDER